MDPTNPSTPSIWPIGFAIGVVCILAGIVVSTPALVVGVVIAVLSATFWIRGASVRVADTPELESEVRGPAPRADEGKPAMPVMDEEEQEATVSRSVFLSGATLGLGGVIGGLVGVPAVGFMVAPAFIKQHPKSVDIGPIDDFPEGQYVIATFIRDPAQGEVTRRTAYIRNNGMVGGVPSFTIISNRCAHLGCPVQPNGPVFDDKKKVVQSGGGEQVTIIPTIPAGGFGCPCHGGQYDVEGNRTAGPPVRALDRYEYEIKNGHLVLLGTYSVAHVDGAGGSAKIKKYDLSGPGEHVDGIESWLYPIQPPH